MVHMDAISILVDKKLAPYLGSPNIGRIWIASDGENDNRTRVTRHQFSMEIRLEERWKAKTCRSQV